MNLLTTNRAEQLLEGARTIRVLVVGDLMLDRYLSGLAERISPEAPVPVVRVQADTMALGGAGNVAANVLALGAQCDVVGCIGRDPEGVFLRERLGELGVGVSGVVETDARPTTVKTRVMARHQHVVRLDREDASDLPAELAMELATHIRGLISSANSLALEDYNKGVLVSSVIRSAIKDGLERSIPIVADPKRNRFFEFGGATVFKPNARELEDALGCPPAPEDSAWMASVREELACETLLLTLGEMGMALESRDQGHFRLPASARDVYDVSGAGDTVTAVMAVLMAAGGSPLEAAILANHAAAVEVGKTGVATVTPGEILGSLRTKEATINEERQ